MLWGGRFSEVKKFDHDHGWSGQIGTPPPMNRQTKRLTDYPTDLTENITFLQLSWRVVKLASHIRRPTIQMYVQRMTLKQTNIFANLLLHKMYC